SDVVGNLVGVLAFALDNDVLVPTPELEIDTTIEMRAAMPHPLDLVSLPPIMLGDQRLERGRVQARQLVVPAVRDGLARPFPVGGHRQIVKLSGQRKYGP